MRQGDLSRVYAFAKQFLHPFSELTALLDIASSMLASGQMDLGEERLAGRTLAPVRIVVHAAIPLEIVIRLAPESLPLFGHPVIAVWYPAS